MNLVEIDVDEFMELIASLDDAPSEHESMILEAMKNIPILQRLMYIYNNAAADDAPKELLAKNQTIISTLLTLYVIEKRTKKK